MAIIFSGLLRIANLNTSMMVLFMKKIHLLTISILCGILIPLHAQSSKTVQEIKNEQSTLALEIFELRKTLIQSDQKLLEMHKQKLELHRKISERISGDSKMATLIEKAIKLQSDLSEASKKLGKTSTPAKQEAEKKEITIKQPAAKTKDEPSFKSRGKSHTTDVEVIDRTADVHIMKEEEEGLSYE